MESPRNRDELMNSILSRSVSDREFRQSLLTDPKTAILKTFGIRVPEEEERVGLDSTQHGEAAYT